MAKSTTENQIISIDIGSCSIKSIIGEIDSDGVINIIGIGKSSSIDGINKGHIVSIDKTVKAIEKSIGAATNMATTKAVSVYITISGDHIVSSNSKAVIAVNDEEISQADLDKVLQKCKNQFYSQSKEVVHLIPQSYSVDEQGGIQNPIGMTGSSLTANVHVALANLSSTKNLVNCINKNSLEVSDIVFAPIASSYGVLNSDEKTLGVTVIDIGYGTTTITVYEKGHIVFSDIIPVGGFNITNDLAISLQIPRELAENLKIKSGYAISEDVNEEQVVDLEDYGEIDLFTVAEIIEERIKEIFLLVRENIKNANLLNKINSGFVLTGGTANLNGIQLLAEKIFDKKVRIGFPHNNIRGLTDLIKHPEYSAGVGLIKFAQENHLKLTKKKDGTKIFKKIGGVFKHWF